MISDINQLAYASADDMVFGTAKHPVSCGYDVVIGGGQVLPEVKFTLPAMLVQTENFEKIRAIYRETATQILQRAVNLAQPALVLEFEQVFEMTRYPEWGAQLTQDIHDVMAQFNHKHGLRSALRVTVADTRESERPPLMRTGQPLQHMLRSFELCAEAGADILSIESTGGKEVSDHALLEADMDGLAFALGVLAPRDMNFLWGHIVGIADKYGVVPGGDTACGFGNTAMQLAHQNMLPKVLAATVRLMSAPRSLAAVFSGARGPLKDCGYENPIIKAITGVPISMEGKSSACAHSSPLGNISAATCDLWSNESVQHVRLLGGYAPEVFAEVLIYDTRLMNTALDRNAGPLFRDLLVQSDRYRDPQALVMAPEILYAAGERIVQAGSDPYAQTVAMAHLAMETLRDAVANETLTITRQEQRWLDRLGRAVDHLPDDPDTLVTRLSPVYKELYLPEEYGL
ncbi:MAG: methyltransferase MtaB domain-containing protein [Anaerolineae bacterium]|nr:methyltransferase MtaB domain-containing protein [Anaerolineae bacterium]